MRWLERHWYRRTLLSFLLLPASWCYCALMALRRSLYCRGVLPSIKLPVPVIVIGNITVGGAGKTPLAIWLARFLQQQGMRPGVVIRGYGGEAPSWPQLVTPASDADEVGDEAVVLARQSGCPVAADPDRVRGARYLVRERHCDVIISDDGLQHLRLARDIEIAVVDGERRFGNGFCLPAGPLREPVIRLREMSLRVAHGAPQENEFGMQLIETRLHRANAPDIQVAPESFRGRPVHAVAGIGHPARFFAHLRRLGMEVIEHPFPDHHRFVPREIHFGDSLPVIMTQKDAVKCGRFAEDNAWYLAVETNPDPRIGEEIWRRLKEKTRG